MTKDDYIWKGEIVIILSIPKKKFMITEDIIKNGLLTHKPSELAKLLAQKSGEKRSDVYQQILGFSV